MKKMILLAVLAIAAGACARSPLAPSQATVSPQVFAEGLPLFWLPASGCDPKRPFPAVAGTAPQRTVLMDRDAASLLYRDANAPVLTAFWPVSEIREAEPHRTVQNFIVGDFIAQDGKWKICFWEERFRE